MGGHYCLTQFYGMEFTTDKLRSMVRKWQSLIEANVDVKTTDGYVLRLFCIGFTKKRSNQLKKTCYASAAQQELIGKEIEKACGGVYPLQNVFIRKVKMLKMPKFDLTKLLEIHGDSGAPLPPKGEDVGSKVEYGGIEAATKTDVVGA